DIRSAISQHAADNALQGVQSEVEVRHDAKVSASTAKSPQELSVPIWTGLHDPSIWCHDLSPDHVIAREPVLRREMPNAAAECETADAGRNHAAARRHESDRLGRRIEIEPGRAALRSGEAVTRVHLYSTHHRQIDDQTIVTDAVACRIVSAAAHGNFEIMFLCEFEGNGDIPGTRTACDHSRAAIDQRVEAPTCGIVLFVARTNDVAGQRPAQLVDVHVAPCHATWIP